MNPMVALREVVGSQSPGTGKIRMDGGGATMLYDVQKADLEEAITYILGSAEPAGDGSIDRSLPLAHPIYPWMFADEITNIQGRGTYTLVSAEDALEAEPPSQFADYQEYRLTVNFVPRPYPVLGNEIITRNALTYTDPDGGLQTATVCNEWSRFVDLVADPKAELIEAQVGQQRLQYDATTAFTYPAKIAGRIPKKILKFLWSQVPYSYVLSANSYLSKYQGYINQTDFYGFEAGTLLFDSIKVRPYPPPLPALMSEPWSNAYAIEKLCDIELICEHAPRLAAYDPGLTNANWIAAGHNVQMHFKDRKFYYARAFGPGTDTDKSLWIPNFFSIPFEILFQDPDT